jgi:Flp pilus assembly protein TadG
MAMKRNTNNRLQHCLNSRGPGRHQKGQAIIEFALVFPLLVFLIFAIIDFSILFYVYQSLENGISLACRYGITGLQQEDPNNSGTKLSREDSIKLVMRQNSPFVTLADQAFAFEHLSGTTWVAGVGGTGEISRVTVSCIWEPICPLIAAILTNNPVNLRVSGTMKNEAYPTP